MTYVTTLRLPDELGAKVELASRAGGLSVAEFIRDAITARVAGLQAEPQFQERLWAYIEAEQRVRDSLLGAADGAKVDL